MRTINIAIERVETRRCVVAIEADSLEEAISLAAKKEYSGEFDKNDENHWGYVSGNINTIEEDRPPF